MYAVVLAGSTLTLSRFDSLFTYRFFWRNCGSDLRRPEGHLSQPRNVIGGHVVSTTAHVQHVLGDDVQWSGNIERLELRPFLYPDFRPAVGHPEFPYWTTSGGTCLSALVVNGVLSLISQAFRDVHGYDLEQTPPRPST